jgi:hypothetical protein
MKNSLWGMLSVLFVQSPYKAINLAYPNRFKSWEFKRVPMNYWTVETGIVAIRWLIEEKLKWSEDDIKRNLSCNVFIENGIGGMFSVVFKSIVFDAINSAYPGRFMPWEIKHTPNHYWTLESGIGATKWLIDKKLKWSESDIKQKLSRNVFSENGLNGMLQICYGKSYKKAIRGAYPDLEM